MNLANVQYLNSITLLDENYLGPANSNLSAYLQCLEKA